MTAPSISTLRAFLVLLTGCTAPNPGMDTGDGGPERCAPQMLEVCLVAEPCDGEGVCAEDEACTRYRMAPFLVCEPRADAGASTPAE